MKADLEYLNKYLQKWHPSYYDYTKKEEMNAFYSRLKDSCTTPILPSIFRTSIYKAINKVGCGHMSITGFKSVATGKNAALLPLKVWVLNNRLFIKSALKKDSALYIGDEILEINGEKASDLIKKTSELAVTDGFNQTHKAYSLTHNFNAFHYFIYEKQDSYDLRIKNQAGKVLDISIKSDTFKSEFATYKMMKDTANRVTMGNAVTLYKTDFDSSTMIIDIDDFNGSGQGKTFKKIFRHLRTHQIKNVVIDLRDNGGGNVFRGHKFLTYFLDASITSMVISRKPNLTFINPRFKGGFFEKITPILFTLNPLQYPNRNGWNHCFLFFKKYRNHFDGNVYVMTNGGTFSMASYVASYLKHKNKQSLLGKKRAATNTAHGRWRADTLRCRIPK